MESARGERQIWGWGYEWQGEVRGTGSMSGSCRGAAGGRKIRGWRKKAL